MPEITLDLHDLDPRASARVVEALRDVDGVEQVRAEDRSDEPGSHKGFGADLVVQLAEKGLPAVVRRMAEALNTLFGLPGAPTELTITVGTRNGPTSFTYDPRQTTLTEAVELMQRLVGPPASAQG